MQHFFEIDDSNAQDVKSLLLYYVDCAIEVRNAKDVYFRFRRELQQRDQRIKAAQEEEENKKKSEKRNRQIETVEVGDIYAQPDIPQDKTKAKAKKKPNKKKGAQKDSRYDDEEVD